MAIVHGSAALQNFTTTTSKTRKKYDSVHEHLRHIGYGTRYLVRRTSTFFFCSDNNQLTVAERRLKTGTGSRGMVWHIICNTYYLRSARKRLPGCTLKITGAEDRRCFNLSMATVPIPWQRFDILLRSLHRFAQGDRMLRTAAGERSAHKKNTFRWGGRRHSRWRRYSRRQRTP